MELAVPIFDQDKVYNMADTKEPKSGTLATAYESMNKGNVFKAILDFVSGCIDNLYSTDGESVNETGKIRSLCGLMPYMTAEAVALKVLAEVNEDDKVEGVYPCPRCGKKVVTEDEGDYDTRDKISELKVNCMSKKDYTNNIIIELAEPVEIKNQKTGEVLESIETFEMRYPTLNDCIMAAHGRREGQEVKMQMQIYINALISVNGKEVDRSWKGTWGMPMFNGMRMKAQKMIQDALLEYGLIKTVQRECMDCGKVWESPINTSNFFVSGLQSI